MTDTAKYVIKFADPGWIRTNPDGSTTSFQTLQAAVEGTKQALMTMRAPWPDIVWYDRAGNEQGHWRGAEHD